MGMIFTGVFAKDVGLMSGHFETFKYHIIALFIVSGFTFFESFLIFKLTGLMTRLRVTPEEERLGLDLSQHSESLYAEVRERKGDGKMEVAAYATLEILLSRSSSRTLDGKYG